MKRRCEHLAHLVAAQRGIVRGRYWSLDMDSAARPPVYENETLRPSRTQEDFIARSLR